MGLIDRLLGRKAEEKAVSFDPVWLDWFGSRQSKAGVPVNWERALDVSTVFACIRVIANGVAQVPLRVMKELPDGKGGTPATEHPLYTVLNRRPNKWMTSFELRETLIFHAALTGNAFFYKNMVRGQVRELIPIDPGCVTITRNNDYSLTYTVSGIDGRSMDFPQSLIWHLRGPSWDTWRGLDAVQQAREAIGLTIATENTQAELHANGAMPSGVYSTDQKIDPEKYKQIQAWIAAQVSGSNRHKPFVIDSNFKWTPQSMSGVDAQHLETRKFQTEQLCQSLGVFPQMIGHAGQAMTFASAEQVFLAHVVHTLGPWWERIQQSIDVNLLDGPEDAGYYAKFNANGLLKGAHKDRAEFYSKALGTGGSPAYMTPNEIRALEDLNPIEGGDELPKPTNVGGAPTPDKPKDGAQDPKNDEK
ncbi:phage portal protein [Sinorhizobium meliloti]|uniref:phage portal protein n=1 Tax=Rhizobium meliloti TaxID=382 RepID=UPI003F170E1E